MTFPPGFPRSTLYASSGNQSAWYIAKHSACSRSLSDSCGDTPVSSQALTTGAERSAYPPPQGHDGLLHGGWLYQAHRVPVAVWTQRQADRALRADVDAVGLRQRAEALLEMVAALGEQLSLIHISEPTRPY